MGQKFELHPASYGVWFLLIFRNLLPKDRDSLEEVLCLWLFVHFEKKYRKVATIIKLWSYIYKYIFTHFVKWVQVLGRKVSFVFFLIRTCIGYDYGGRNFIQLMFGRPLDYGCDIFQYYIVLNRLKNWALKNIHVLRAHLFIHIWIISEKITLWTINNLINN